MLYLALALLFIASIFFWQSGRQRKAAGLPGGRIIYTDTHGWNKVEKPLYNATLDLTGKPDYLIEKDGQIIPVEVTVRLPYLSTGFLLSIGGEDI